jgi:hypothetical protein
MIKQFGTLGFFVKFNESSSAGFKLVEVFSSSAATTTLFSASTNLSKNLVYPTTASSYINGSSSKVLVDNQWQHVTFSFNTKLQTDSDNNFLVRFGTTGSCDFQIQNLYFLDTLLEPLEISYLHGTFVGASAAISTGESASGSVRIIDRDESRHSSSVTSTVYQPYLTQNRFLADIDLVTASSLSAYTGSPTNKLIGDLRYFDGVVSTQSNQILSIADNQIYQINSVGGVTLISSSNGDYVNVLSGTQYANTTWLKTSGSFTRTPILEKIINIVDRSQQ